MQIDCDIRAVRTAIRLADVHHQAGVFVEREVLERLVDAAEGYPTDDEVEAMWDQEQAEREHLKAH